LSANQSPGQSKVCDSCGAQVSSPYVFCGNCGAYLGDWDPGSPDDPPPNRLQPGTHHCLHCGTLVSDLARTCPQCFAEQPKPLNSAVIAKPQEPPSRSMVWGFMAAAVIAIVVYIALYVVVLILVNR
jgi:predicted amidophosphoribosyltransferase